MLQGMTAFASAQKTAERLHGRPITVDGACLEQEPALLVCKSNAGEETARRMIHASEAHPVLHGMGAAGGRANFLFPELKRQANTSAAGALSPHSSQIAVNLKGLVKQDA